MPVIDNFPVWCMNYVVRYHSILCKHVTEYVNMHAPVFLYINIYNSRTLCCRWNNSKGLPESGHTKKNIVAQWYVCGERTPAHPVNCIAEHWTNKTTFVIWQDSVHTATPKNNLVQHVPSRNCKSSNTISQSLSASPHSLMRLWTILGFLYNCITAVHPMTWNNYSCIFLLFE